MRCVVYETDNEQIKLGFYLEILSMQASVSVRHVSRKGHILNTTVQRALIHWY
jgi:hypothetical protein